MRLKKKHIAAIALSVAICVGATGCKSEEVKNTEKLIKEIDSTITLSSESAIEQAEAAYNALGEEQKDVSNAQQLTDARAAYDELYQNEVAPVEQAIASIPDESALLTDDNAEKLVEAARLSYIRASDEAQSLISNYSILENAEKILEDARVQNAIDAINQIGDVTLESAEMIEAADAAYNNVESTRRSDVTNYNTLLDARSAYSTLQQKAKEQARQQALSRLKKETDTVENRTWYYPSSYPKYINTRSFVLPYLGEVDGQLYMRLKFDYVGDDWVFFDQVIINIDGDVVDTIDFGYTDVERDTALYGHLYECADIAPTDRQIGFLRKIADSQKTVIRFKGNYAYDLTVSEKDKQGIKDILAVYDSANL